MCPKCAYLIKKIFCQLETQEPNEQFNQNLSASKRVLSEIWTVQMKMTCPTICVFNKYFDGRKLFKFI
jgi:hypothetical protein